MSSARIAKLEALLARVATRRGQPRLAIVQPPAPEALEAKPATGTPPAIVAAFPAVEAKLAEAVATVLEAPAHAAASIPAPAALEHPSELTPTLPPPALGGAAEGVAPVALAAPEPRAEPAPEPMAHPAPLEVPVLSPATAHVDGAPSEEKPIAAEPPREDRPAPRLSLPVRPSLPSPEFVPEALPFTLMTERPPAMPTAKDTLDLGAISLTTAPNMSGDFGKGLPGTIEVSTLRPASGALTLVPSARASIPNDLDDDVEVLPLPPLPTVALTQHHLERPGAAGEPILAPRPVLKAPATLTTSALRSPAPRTFGALLERSLALRPRTER